MKTLKHFCASLTLIAALSGVVFAGQSDSPPVTSPTPPPTQMTYDDSSTTADSESDPLMEIGLSLIQTILSIF